MDMSKQSRLASRGKTAESTDNDLRNAFTFFLIRRHFRTFIEIT